MFALLMPVGASTEGELCTTPRYRCRLWLIARACLGDNPTAKRLGFALSKVDGDRTGPLATRRCQLRQAREGATVAAPSCAEV